MNLSWKTEILAIVRKEIQSEARNQSASFTSFMLSAVTVFTLAFAFYGRSLGAEAAAGMLWAALLFAGVGTLTRIFVSEEEQGTADLLRVWARPHAVFYGKAAFALLLMSATAVIVALLFFTLTGVGVSSFGLLALTLLGGSAALSGLVTLVSALISRGNNRGSLAGVVAFPLLIPLVALGVNAARSAIDGTQLSAGWSSCAGVWLYTVLVFAMAPYQFAAVWREL